MSELINDAFAVISNPADFSATAEYEPYYIIILDIISAKIAGALITVIYKKEDCESWWRE